MMDEGWEVSECDVRKFKTTTEGAWAARLPFGEKRGNEVSSNGPNDLQHRMAQRDGFSSIGSGETEGGCLHARRLQHERGVGTAASLECGSRKWGSQKLEQRKTCHSENTPGWMAMETMVESPSLSVDVSEGSDWDFDLGREARESFCQRNGLPLDSGMQTTEGVEAKWEKKMASTASSHWAACPEISTTNPSPLRQRGESGGAVVGGSPKDQRRGSSPVEGAAEGNRWPHAEEAVCGQDVQIGNQKGQQRGTAESWQRNSNALSGRLPEGDSAINDDGPDLPVARKPRRTVWLSSVENVPETSKRVGVKSRLGRCMRLSCCLRCCKGAFARWISWMRESVDELNIKDVPTPTRMLIPMDDDRVIIPFPLRYRREEIEGAYQLALSRVMAPRLWLLGVTWVLFCSIIPITFVVAGATDEMQVTKGTILLRIATSVLATSFGLMLLIIAPIEACRGLLEVLYVLSASSISLLWLASLNYIHLTSQPKVGVTRLVFSRTRDFVVCFSLPLPLLRIREKRSLILSVLLHAMSLNSAAWLLAVDAGTQTSSIVIDVCLLMFVMVGLSLVTHASEYAHRLLFIRLYMTRCRLLMTMRTLHDSRMTGVTQVDELHRLILDLHSDFQQLEHFFSRDSESTEVGGARHSLEASGSSELKTRSRALSFVWEEDNGSAANELPSGVMKKLQAGGSSSGKEASKPWEEALVEIQKTVERCTHIVNEFQSSFRQTDGEAMGWQTATSEDRCIIQAYMGLELEKTDSTTGLMNGNGEDSSTRFQTEKGGGRATSSNGDSHYGLELTPQVHSVVGDERSVSNMSFDSDREVRENVGANDGSEHESSMSQSLQEDRYSLQPWRPFVESRRRASSGAGTQKAAGMKADLRSAVKKQGAGSFGTVMRLFGSPQATVHELSKSIHNESEKASSTAGTDNLVCLAGRHRVQLINADTPGALFDFAPIRARSSADGPARSLVLRCVGEEGLMHLSSGSSVGKAFRRRDCRQTPQAQAEWLLQNFGHDWSLDVLSLNERSSPFHGNLVVEVGVSLLSPLLSLVSGPASKPCFYDKRAETIGITRGRLMRLLLFIQNGYSDRPYHNQVHAAAVAHMAMCLASMVGIRLPENGGLSFARSEESKLSPKVSEILFVVAALGHDIGHPGVNNTFLIHGAFCLALLYNDKHVLENYHAARTLQVLSQKDIAILSAFDGRARRMFRKIVIELILATDAASHFGDLSEMRSQMLSPSFNPIGDFSSGWGVAKFCLKTGDVGHACIDWEAHCKWAQLVNEEFLAQGREEKRLGFDVSPLCQPTGEKEFARNQACFVQYMVLPLVELLDSICPTGQLNTQVSVRCTKNYERWHEAANRQ